MPRSGGRLDQIKARIPMMVLASIAQDKGCDAIAAAWAASRRVKLVAFHLDRRLGQRAGFARNEAILRLKSVEALVCEGSGLQSHLARLVRQAGVPAHILTLSGQTGRAKNLRAVRQARAGTAPVRAFF